MSKNKNKINKQFNTPHTYIIIFFVVIVCWIATFFIPVGRFDVQDISYKNKDGSEKTRSVLIPESFRYEYNLDYDKLYDELNKIVENEILLNEYNLDSAAITEFLNSEKSSWSEEYLDDIGLTEPIIYKLFNESVYNTDSKNKVQVNIWGTDDFGGFGFLNYVFEGLCTGDKWGAAVGILVFVLVIGGAFGVILRTGSIDAGIYSTIRLIKGYEIAAIPVLFSMFSLAGAVFGMSEECIPFAMIIIPFVVAMGYDSLVGIGVTYVATQVGQATSWMNPFGITIAQGIAGVPVMSGAGFRIIMWVVTTTIACIYLMIYAKKIKANPQRSVAYESDIYWRSNLNKSSEEEPKFTTGDKLVILSFFLGIVWVIWGVTSKGYYIPEIASQFFVIGLVVGIIGVVFKLKDMKINDIATSFQKGVSDLAGAAIVVGMAKGILLVLGGTQATDPTVLNTIAHQIGESLISVPTAICALLMYIVQTIFNFFVTSGAGQAAITMPIMASISDVVGISRQISTLAFQLGAGFADAIVPTSASLMGVIGVAKIDWGKYFKWQIKMQGVLFVIGAIFIIIAVSINFS